MIPSCHSIDRLHVGLAVLLAIFMGVSFILGRQCAPTDSLPSCEECERELAWTKERYAEDRKKWQAHGTLDQSRAEDKHAVDLAAVRGDFDARTQAIDDANREASHAQLGPVRSVEAAHLGPLWAEHVKEEKAKEDAERLAREEEALAKKNADDLATAEADEEARFHNFTKADGTSYGDCKPKSYAQGIYTLIDRDGDEHKIAKEGLSDADQEFLDRWIRSVKPEIVPAPPEQPKKTPKRRPR